MTLRRAAFYPLASLLISASLSFGQPTIKLIAGGNANSPLGDGGPAVDAFIGQAGNITVDSAGNLYIWDVTDSRIRKVNTAGMITTVAGGPNTSPNEVDGGPAIGVNVGALDVAVDSSGNLYIYGGNRVYKVSGLPGSTTPPGPPVISANGVQNGASFLPGAVANSWVTIKGTNLAPLTDNWSNSIVGGVLPILLDGVSVGMGGKPAYIYYITSGQLNVLAPDISPGPVSVTVTTPSGTSAAVTATVSQYGPAFFLWPGSQVVATRQDYSYAVAAGTFAGATTAPAKPGDVLILWGTGFGPTTPLAPDGVEVPSTASYSTSAVTVTVDNLPATVYGAALASGSVGLYQIAIQVPTTLANGNWPIQAQISGVASPAGTILTVQQ